ncbi:sialomucin core protein 24 [Heteronotia binoei]|uniref:sialomucin core protein 24 n=1 Tax=Heteronotia binoei TaxID=13085 RepID=UPI002930A4E8|nr:sialomucin core protein 24 [Heteronotia binoei]
MASRRPSTPLDLAILLVVVASCLTSLNGVAAETEEVDCAIHTNCSSCLNLNSTLNSSCQWLDCKEVDQSRCTNKTNEHGNCSIFTGHEQCLAPTSNTTITPPRTTASSPTTGNTTHIPSPKVTTATVISTTIPELFLDVH